jgi:hypothetical protein
LVACHYFPCSFVPTKEPKALGSEKRAKDGCILLKEINAPWPGLSVDHVPGGMISFFTLHFVIFLTLFFLRPNGLQYRLE